MSLSSFGYIVLAALIVLLVGVAQCQRAENESLYAEIEHLTDQVSVLQTQLAETIEQRDAERRRIIETAKRIDEALTLFVNNTEDAHDEHEERMEVLSHIESPETLDWLCEPVPDDIRRLFGFDTADGDSSGSQICRADGADAAMY